MAVATLRRRTFQRLTMLLVLATVLNANVGQAQELGQTVQCSRPNNMEPYFNVLRSLEKVGVRVERVCRSRLEGTFSASVGAALVASDRGTFELIVFASPEALAEFDASSTTSTVDGKPYYITTVTGLDARPAPFEAQGTQRMRFRLLENMLVVTYDDLTETAIGEALASDSARR